MTIRYSHLSQAHLKDAVAALNNLGSGKEMVNISSDSKKAVNLQIDNPLESLSFAGRDGRI